MSGLRVACDGWEQSLVRIDVIVTVTGPYRLTIQERHTAVNSSTHKSTRRRRSPICNHYIRRSSFKLRDREHFLVRRQPSSHHAIGLDVFAGQPFTSSQPHAITRSSVNVRQVLLPTIDALDWCAEERGGAWL